MEEALGRKLGPDEWVHHINEDPRDNRPENLRVMSPQAHSQLHNGRHPIVKQCANCGVDFEPPVKHRARDRTCSWECRAALIAATVGEQKGTTKLTAEDVTAIRRRVAEGERQNALASEFGVGVVTINHVVHRRTWKHVP